MPNQESTAINDLIHLVQGRRLERESENPVPEVYVTAARLRQDPAPRVASGTRPPPLARAIVPAPQVANVPQVAAPHDALTSSPQVAAPRKPAQKKVYRVEHDDEQTELWNSNANVDTAPAVPPLPPHAVTVIATPHAPVVPAILRGPVAPQSDPHAPHSSYADPHAAHAQHPHARAPHAPTARPQALPAIAHPVSLSPQYPAIAISVAPPAPVQPASPASWLIAREVLTSWGTLAVIAAIALGIGVYVAIATDQKETAVAAPTERDRAIAIMNGTAKPEPEHTVVHAPVKIEPTAEPITTPRPAPFDTPTTAGSAPAESAPAATEDASAQADDAKPADPVAAADVDADATDETIDADAIEIEPMNARPSKRSTRRSSRAKSKVVAKAVASGDPVRAILEEKPAKADKAKATLAEKKSRKVKEPSGAATEISAPKGALAAKGTGKVTITSDVAALIYLDGRPTGKTAPSAFVVPVGDHQITLLDPASKKAKTATVQIAANKSVGVRKDFN